MRDEKNDEPLEALRPVVSAEQVVRLQQVIRQVGWQPEVERYLLSIVCATREHAAVSLGVSPVAHWLFIEPVRHMPRCRGETTSSQTT